MTAEWDALLDSGQHVFIVTGSSGYLGQELCRRLDDLQRRSIRIVGVDPVAGAYTSIEPSDEAALSDLFASIDSPGSSVYVFHCGALHKPQVRTHSEDQFVELNVSFTLHLLQRLRRLQHCRVAAVVYTSTTSVWSSTVAAAQQAHRASWVTESTPVNPKNIYGWSKLSAEGLCQLYARHYPCAVLRACRFFPEEDDREAVAGCEHIADDDNLKFLHAVTGRRLTLADVADVHFAALRATVAPTAAPFAVYMLGNWPLFAEDEAARLYTDCRALMREKLGADVEHVFAQRSWQFPSFVDRIYDARATFTALNWQPKDTPAVILQKLLQQPDQTPCW